MKLLAAIAEHFVKEYRNELYTYRFIFPNRRSGVFFKHYLHAHAEEERPFLSPEIMTLEQLFASFSSQEQSDPLLLAYELYCSYLEIKAEDAEEENREIEFSFADSFDSFFHLAQQILVDFDDIDKHLVDAQAIFRNLKEYKELENFDETLSEQQREAMQYLIKVLYPEKYGAGGKSGQATHSDSQENRHLHRERFLLFWSRLQRLYPRYKQRLREKKMAYSGMQTRALLEQLMAEEAENGKATRLKDGMINVFVGLNALTPVETKILQCFQRSTESYFYWDYRFKDLKKSDLASFFTEQNLKLFPPPAEGEKNFIPQEPLELPEEITVYSLPSAIAQTRLIGDLLKVQTPSAEELLHTAIVLPKEQLLLPMLNNIPENIADLNVTMGYPMQNTGFVGLMELMMLLQRKILTRQGKESEQEFYFRYNELEQLLSSQVLSEVLGDSVLELLRDIKSRNLIYVPAKLLKDQEEWPKEARPASKDAAELYRLLFVTIKPEEGEKLLPYLRSVINFFITRLYKKPEDPLEQLEEADQQISPSETSSDEDEKQPQTEQDMDAVVLPQLLRCIVQQESLLEELHRISEGKEALALSLSTVSAMLSTVLQQANIPYEGEPLQGLQIMGMLETRGLDFDTLYIPDAEENVLPPKRSNMGLIPHSLRKGFNLPNYQWHERVRAYHFFRLISTARKLVFTYDARKNQGSSGELSRYLRQLEYVFGAKIEHKSAQYLLKKIPVPDDDYEIDQERVRDFVDEVTRPHSGVRLSASKLKTFFSCPRQFYYKVICGIEEEGEMLERLDPSTLGTIVHNALHELYEPFKNTILNKEQLSALLDEKQQQHRVRGAILRAFKQTLYGDPDSVQECIGINEAYLIQAKELVCNVIRNDINNPYAIKYLGGEQRLELRLPISEGSDTAINFVMYIDRIDAIPALGQLRIIDYKTGRDERPKKMSQICRTPLPAKYSGAFQLYIYSEALRQCREPWIKELFESYPKLCPLIMKPLEKDPELVLNLDAAANDPSDFNYLNLEGREEFLTYLAAGLQDIVNEEYLYPPCGLASCGCCM